MQLKNKVEGDRATEANNYTTKQLAELLGISSSCVNNIAIRYNIPKKVLIALSLSAFIIVLRADASSF